MRISFRFKIQLAVVLILAVTIFSYISFASQFIERDRLASLIDNTASQGALAENKISKKFASLRFWVDQVMHKNPQERERESEFKKNEHLIAFGIREAGHITWVYHKNPEDLDQALPLEFPDGNTFFANSQRHVFCLAIRSKTGTENFSFWSTELLDTDFNQNDGELFALVPAQGVPYIAGNFNIPESFWATIPKPSEIKRSQVLEKQLQGESFFLSLTTLESYPVLIVLGYPKALALEPVRELRWMSLSFAIFALGLTGFFSLWLGKVLTQKLQHLTNETARIASGDLEAGTIIDTQDEVGDLSKSISVMSVSLKNLLAGVAEKSRMETELKTAQAVQETLVPREPYSEGEFSMHGILETASECGGDFWFHWKSAEYLFFVIADATGHGAPAALITSAVRSTISSLKLIKQDDLRKIVLHLHTSVSETSRSQIMMTAFIGKLETKSGVLQYFDCSHERPFLFGLTHSAMQTLDGPKSPRLGDSHCQPHDFKDSFIEILKGDQIFFYTDGLIDGEDRAGIPFSARRLHKFLTSEIKKKVQPQMLLESTLAQIKDNSSSTLKDDITAMILSRRSS